MMWQNSFFERIIMSDQNKQETNDNIATDRKPELGMLDKKETKEDPSTQAQAPEYHRGIVLYSDGGSRPNPGFAGWGAHGYLYTTEPSNKGSGLIKQLITPFGYVPNAGDAKQKHKVVQPLEYFDFFGTSGTNTSNNAAEVDALRHSLAHIKTYDVKSIQVFTDSEYLRRGAMEWLDSWKRRNWVRDDGTQISNAHNWQSLAKEIDSVKEKNIDFSIQWVKGHADNFGNIIADKLATIGVMHSVNEQPKNECAVSPAQGYWKSEVERHPFIHMRRGYFNSVSEFNTPGHYYLAEPGGDDFLIGKKVPESAYCVVRLLKPENVIETVKARQFEVANMINAVMMLRLDKVYNPDVYDYIEQHGKYTLLPASKSSLGLNFVDNKPVTIEMNPPGLCLRAIDNFQHLDEMLDRFLKPDDATPCFGYKVHPITDAFYNVVEKKVKKEVVAKHELKSDFGVGFKALKIDVTVPVLVDEQSPSVRVGEKVIRTDPKDNSGELDHRVLSIPLVLGLDLPGRNSLKHLEDLNPRINLITWHESVNSLRYACVVEVDSGIGIWSNYFADKILLK